MTSRADKRKSPRHKVQFNVILSHPEGGQMPMQIRDMSEGGVFVHGPLETLPLAGALVDLQVRGMLGQDCASVQMRVIREDDEGLALRFVQ